jgi:D-lactate dehydrogenase
MDIANALHAIISPQRVLTRPLERLAYANDASYYYFVPQAVVQPQTISEVQALFRFSHQYQIPLTFRAAGTSLCGQASTDGILVDISKHWGDYQIEEGGLLLRAQPGIVGGFLNTVLRPFGRRIGPDPASIDACMLGGILANNSSGMCCGVVENAYHTLHSLTFVLPDGFCLNTALPDAHKVFENEQAYLSAGLLDLRARLLADTRLAERVRRRYQMKNTNGYALNAFVDYEKPLDIFTHLLIGSEGTLAFIAEAVLHTLPEYPQKYTAQLYFKDIRAASSAVFPLRESGARAIEIMDRAALRSVESLPGVPEVIKTLPQQAAAILVEYQAEDEDTLDTYRRTSQRTLSELSLLHEAEFTRDADMQAILWKARKGMFATVGAIRPPGTTLLLEDVVFPVPKLAQAIGDLQAVFAAYGYDDSIIFGHAKDGNLHFTVSQSFDSETEIDRFDGFMRDLVKIVSVKYDGALKGEHGTGRSMAPFLADEWGDNAVAIMRDLKALVDPAGWLNPNVIMDTNPMAHISHVKEIPLTDPLVDQCIECGYCESKCPSRRLTLTPRQRIVIQRAFKRFSNLNSLLSSPDTLQVSSQFSGLDPKLFYQEALRDWQYAGLDTCAVDGLCATACPISINTGDLVKHQRSQAVTPLANRLAVWVAEHFRTIEIAIRMGVSAGHILDRLTFKSWRWILFGMEKVSRITLPKWNDAVPRVSRRIQAQRSLSRKGIASETQWSPEFVYFPSCISRNLGLPSRGAALSLPEAMMQVCGRAGVQLEIPEDIAGICCGMPFGSKGYQQANQAMLHRTIERFWRWSDEGRKPIVIDTTSCAYTLRTCAYNLSAEDQHIYQKLTILDSLEFMHDVLLPRLKLSPLKESVALHPNCSARKMGLQGIMIAIAQQCAESVTVPLNLDCCGFAGDRGLLFPEFTASAAALEAKEICAQPRDGYYSSNIPCEMGMSVATGKDYVGLVYLLERASRQREGA